MEAKQNINHICIELGVKYIVTGGHAALNVLDWLLCKRQNAKVNMGGRQMDD